MLEGRTIKNKYKYMLNSIEDFLVIVPEWSLYFNAAAVVVDVSGVCFLLWYYTVDICTMLIL